MKTSEVRRYLIDRLAELGPDASLHDLLQVLQAEQVEEALKKQEQDPHMDKESFGDLFVKLFGSLE